MREKGIWVTKDTLLLQKFENFRQKKIKKSNKKLKEVNQRLFLRNLEHFPILPANDNL